MIQIMQAAAFAKGAFDACCLDFYLFLNDLP